MKIAIKKYKNTERILKRMKQSIFELKSPVVRGGKKLVKKHIYSLI
jgi:hypothetical protein